MMSTNPTERAVALSFRTRPALYRLIGPALLLSIMLLTSPLVWARDSTVAALAPGVVLDRIQQRAFLLEPGRLTGRSLDDGALIWELPGEIEPLGLQAGRLIAMRSSTAPHLARLVQINPARGRIENELELSFPSGVRVRIAEGPGEKFQAQLLQSSDSIRLQWHYSRHPLRGAPAISGVSRPPKLPREANPNIDDAGPRAGSTMIEPEGMTERRSGVIEITGFGEAAQVSTAAATRGDATALHWNELRGEARRSGPTGRQFTASVDETVLISERLASEPALGRFRWTILDATNQPVGTFETRYAFAPFALADDRFAYVARPWTRIDGGRLVEHQRLALIVVDLSSGSEAWQAELLDKAWRRSMPP
ncbi:MAG: hypothetical protein V2J10_00055 [Wenzhouxiangella sp.]|jgi:hypothetical protein|nr:hypothetical protein [Wenzhouxiangella sp.]